MEVHFGSNKCILGMFQSEQWQSCNEEYSTWGEKIDFLVWILVSFWLPLSNLTVLPTRIPGRLPARTTPPTPPARSSSYGGRYSGHSGSRGGVSDGSIYVPSRPNLPTPPPRSSPFGGRYSGASGSRNTVGDGSIYNRLFGDDRFYGSRTTTTPRPRSQLGSNGYYTSHTSIDAQGNRVWTFSG